ncbi:Abi family protein [Rothia sp. L_38]|uniref:Abi family protein n=1 Tax=Rothia sp. L_38 TaxID=3422315 RepID=UPI003D6A0444
MTYFKEVLTDARFEQYLVAANRDYSAAKELYAWNTRISGAFYELLSYVEVSLRNAVDKVLKEYEPPASVVVNSNKSWWFSNPAFLKDAHLKFADTAVGHLQRNDRTKKYNYSRDKIISSITFGLWEEIFSKDYENIFRQHLVYAFPDRRLTDIKMRKDVLERVSSLRLLRNRIAHHQHIFHLPLEERFDQAIEIITAIDKDFADWVESNSQVKYLLSERPAVGPQVAVVVPVKEKSLQLYNKLGVYVCQPNRFFQGVSHLGFYNNRHLLPDLAKIIKMMDNVPWAPEEIEKHRSMHTEEGDKLAEIIKEARSLGWNEFDEYQIFFLSRDSDDDSEQVGHITLDSSLSTSKSGRGSAWVRKQRYVMIDQIQEVTSLDDLDK